MSFLAPVWLLLGLAAAVPLLIHLMRRRIGTRVEFPAARYLARAEREHSRQLRLRNLLLMLLRVAIVLLIALAAARPVARVAGAGHAPAAVAVVLDNSLSTSVVEGGTSVLERLKARARDVIARATANDRLYLITADGQVRGGSRASVLDAIARVEPLGGAGDAEGAAARGASLVRASPLPGHAVAILTDGQRTAWSRPVLLGDVAVSVAVPGDAAPANHAVIDARAEPERWTPRGAVTARVLTADTASYRISLGAETLARGTAAPAPGATMADVLVRAAPADRGWVAGTVELEPDELRGDDVRHFALWIGAPPAVAVDSSAGAFVRSAVDVLVGARQATTTSLGAPQRVEIGGADGVTARPALLIAPTDPVRLGAANRVLQRLGIPWRFGAAQRGEVLAHGPMLDGVTATLRYPLVAQAGAVADTLATTAGVPWVVAGDGYVLVGSPLDPAATTLPVRAAFVPWLADVLAQRLSGAPGRVTSAVPDAPVALPPGVDALETPEGRRFEIGGERQTILARPGVYFLTRDARRVGAVVVNPEGEESVLDRLDAAGLRNVIRGRAVRVLAPGDALGASVFAGASRRPLLGAALIAALVLVLAESIVVGAGVRRGA